MSVPTGKNLAMLRQELRQGDPNRQMDLLGENDHTVHLNHIIEQIKAIEISEVPIDTKKVKFIVKHTTRDLKVATSSENGNGIVTAKIPLASNYDKIFIFMKENMLDIGTHYIYFESKHLYKDFSKVFIENFNYQGPKLVRCTKRIQVIYKEEDQLELIGLNHEGKTSHRGIEETLSYLKRNYWWKT